MKHLLEIDGVMVGFNGLQVLSNIYLSCETQKVTGIIGRNGAGKSTLFNILFGELRPENSSIRIDGIPLLTTERKPSDLRYLPQFEFFPSSLSIQSVFDFFQCDFGEFLKVFPDFDNEHLKKLRELSGGQRRLIEVYCILKSETKFCVLDEPFSQLMPLHIEKVKALIQTEKRHKGILCSDHMYGHILDLSDDLQLLQHGGLATITDKDDLVKHGYLSQI